MIMRVVFDEERIDIVCQNKKYVYRGNTLIPNQCSTNTNMSELQEIRRVFQGLQTLYETYFPKADPVLVHDLLTREQENPKNIPLYMVEIFTKPGIDSELIKNRIFEKTGNIPAIYDKGTHYVTNQRLTLEVLKEICDSEDVLEVTGDYTGSITARGASHEHREHIR
jgi:hypothetical protein